MFTSHAARCRLGKSRFQCFDTFGNFHWHTQRNAQRHAIERSGNACQPGRTGAVVGPYLDAGLAQGSHACKDVWIGTAFGFFRAEQYAAACRQVIDCAAAQTGFRERDEDAPFAQDSGIYAIDMVDEHAVHEAAHATTLRAHILTQFAT